MGAAAEILCVGGAAADRKFALQGPLIAGTSNPARGASHFGGVARNVCETLARLGIATALSTRIGTDAAGRQMLEHLHSLGAGTGLIQVDPARTTAEYIAVLAADGGLEFGVADMAIFDAIAEDESLLAEKPRWIFADCNLPSAILAHLAASAAGEGIRLAVDCVSVAKSARLPADLSGIHLLFANADEAAAAAGSGLAKAEAAAALIARGAEAVVVTLGADGLVLVRRGAVSPLPAVPALVTDVTGAGDALIAVTLAALAKGADLVAALQLGQRAAALTIGSASSVRADLGAALGWTGARALKEEQDD